MDVHCSMIHDAMLDSICGALGLADSSEPVGVAFSGGVDSSLLAAVCKTMGHDVRLLTVGFAQSHDVEFAGMVAPLMPGLPQHYTLEFSDAAEFDGVYDAVQNMMTWNSLSWIENAIAFYRVSVLARDAGVGRVIAANGIDELFCGYDAYRRALHNDNCINPVINYDDYNTNTRATNVHKIRGDNACGMPGHEDDGGLLYGNIDINDARVHRIIHELVQQKLENELKMFDAIGKMVRKEFGIRLLQPLLDEGFCRTADKVPLSEKIKGPDDMLRKHVIRRLARAVGVPQISYERRKKALQYGSGIHKAVLRVRKRRGLPAC